MKLLIIAGPYEADRLRRAAVSAGFEAIAVEPGESLSGWITATRPDVIIVAPQIISTDPVAALAKVRAVPRGRVPIFLVGEADQAAALQPLADGFFVRPVSPEDLLAKAREATAGRGPGASRPSGAGRPGAGAGSAAAARLPPPAPAVAAPEPGSGRWSAKTPTLKPLVAAREPEGVLPPARQAERAPVKLPPPRPPLTMFDGLADTIEADFDAEIDAVVRDVGDMRRRVPAHPSAPGPTTSVDHRVAEFTTIDQAPAAVRENEVDLDLPALLARMYLSRLSGRLSLRRGQVTKFIVFERGHPVLAGSSRVEDRMGAMLVRQGRATPEQIASSGAEVGATGRRLGAVLVDRGIVKATDLSSLVRRHYEEVIYSLFMWGRGAWNLGTDVTAAAEKVLLSQHPAALIVEGIRRKYTAERSLVGLGGSDRIFRLRLTTGASDLLEKMGITQEERNLVLLFDGVRSLEEIRALTGAPPERLYGVAWALTVLERLDVVDRSPHAASALVGTGAMSSAADGQGAGARASSSSSASDRDGEAGDPHEAIDRALVQSRYARVVDGDYFQILGLPRDCSAQEIQRAHQASLAELAPEALHPSVAAEWHAELAEVREVLDEAARLLADDSLRQRYRDNLSAPAEAASAGARGGPR